MNISEKSCLLKVIIGETDKVYKRPLHEAIVYGAKRKGLAGATVTRGIMSYGANSKVNTMKIFALSIDLPIVIEIIDNETPIREYAEIVEKLFEKSGCGGIIAIQDIDVIRYQKRKR